MRTTLDLPDDTFRKLKAEAAMRGFKLKELVTQLIENGLSSGLTQLVSPRSRSPLSVARPARGGHHPGLTQAQSRETQAPEVDSIPSELTQAELDAHPWLPIARRYVRPGMSHDMDEIREAIALGWATEAGEKLADYDS
jgi:hypothetical protein